MRSRVGVQGLVRRGLASAPAKEEKDDGKLPLKGIRVLDMTRVLAGVCIFPLVCLFSTHLSYGGG